MSAFTIRFVPCASQTTIAALDGFSVEWCHSPRYGRSYALIEQTNQPARALDGLGATVFDRPVIALALRPNLREALPLLDDALGGSGRPAGIRDCTLVDDALVVEWDLETTPASVILAVIRVELSRIQASCANELLSPLPLSWWTRLAADGLGAPEVAPDRVLEALIESHDVVS